MSKLTGTRYGYYEDLSKLIEAVAGRLQQFEYFTGLQDGEKIGPKEFCSNHKLKLQLFRDVLNQYHILNSTKVNLFHVNTGRPLLLDSPAKVRLIKNLVEMKNHKKSAGKVEFII